MSKIQDILEEWDGFELKTTDGFDDCIIGVMQRFGNEPFIAYDIDKVVEKLIKDGMSPEEAMEFFEFNIIGAYVGPNTPGYVQIYGR